LESSESPREQEAAALRRWFSSQRRFGSWAAMERALGITTDYLHLVKDGKRRAVDPNLRRKLFDATGLKIFKDMPPTLKSKPPSPLSQSVSIRPVQRPPTKHVANDVLPSDLSSQITLALKKLQLTIRGCAAKYGISPNALKKYKSGVRRPSSEKNVKAIIKILDDARILRISQEEQGEDGYAKATKIKKLLLELAKELDFFKQNSEASREVFRKVIPGEDIGYITTLLRALYNEDQFQRWLLFSKYEMISKSEK